jgi:competence protein ComEC
VPLLVVSHPHTDHVGGLTGVLRGRRIGSIAVGPATQPPGGKRLVTSAARQRRISVLEPGVGWSYRIGAVGLVVLGPARPFTGTRSDPNNNSLVIRAEVAGVSVLLSGDAENAAQQALISSGVRLRADVLKVPHHGSAYSEPDFLAAVRPAIALVEVGLGNDYGHPNAGVLARLRHQHTRVLRTDTDGDIAVLVDRGRLAVATRGPEKGRAGT